MRSQNGIKLTAQRIIQIVERSFNLDDGEILSGVHVKKIVFPRHIAAYLIRKDMGCAWSTVGRFLKRSVWGVRYGFGVVSERLAASAELAFRIDEMRKEYFVEETPSAVHCHSLTPVRVKKIAFEVLGLDPKYGRLQFDSNSELGHAMIYLLRTDAGMSAQEASRFVGWRDNCRADSVAIVKRLLSEKESGLGEKIAMIRSRYFDPREPDEGPSVDIEALVSTARRFFAPRPTVKGQQARNRNFLGVLVGGYFLEKYLRLSHRASARYMEYRNPIRLRDGLEAIKQRMKDDWAFASNIAYIEELVLKPTKP